MRTSRRVLKSPKSSFQLGLRIILIQESKTALKDTRKSPKGTRWRGRAGRRDLAAAFSTRSHSLPIHNCYIEEIHCKYDKFYLQEICRDMESRQFSVSSSNLIPGIFNNSINGWEEYYASYYTSNVPYQFHRNANNNR